MTIPARKKILGIGYPKFAIAEFEELAKTYDIFYFHPDDRKQVISEVKRLTDAHGPFDASWVVSLDRRCRVARNSRQSCTTLRAMPRLTRKCSRRYSSTPGSVGSSPRAERVSHRLDDGS